MTKTNKNENTDKWRERRKRAPARPKKEKKKGSTKGCKNNSQTNQKRLSWQEENLTFVFRQKFFL